MRHIRLFFPLLIHVFLLAKIEASLEQQESVATSTTIKPLLPSFSSGGLVFFLHIPKTGGTSIRRNVEQFDHIQYVFAKNFSVYWDTAPLVEDLILGESNRRPFTDTNSAKMTRNNNNTILFYEIHATTSPSFYRMRNRLQRWRETAKRNGIPMFFFTLVRSPIPYALSHFNFFHVDQRNPTFEHCNATEENFLRLSLHNPQCQFLWKGEPSMRSQLTKQTRVTPEQCELIQSAMAELLDWVGTTEDLSTDTLPLLSRLLELPPTFQFDKKYRVTAEIKKTDQYFDLKDLSPSTLQTIDAMSSLDATIYEYAKDFNPPWKEASVGTDEL